MGVMRNALLALVLPTLAMAEPTYHRVTGVADDDALNVRGGPSANAVDLGDLGPDTHRLEVLGFDGSGDWARIAWGERDGWVSARFLSPDQPDTLESSSLPDGLVCNGTEPFWSISLSTSNARFTEPGAEDVALQISDVTVAAGRLGSPARVTLHGKDTRARVTVLGETCSDGMSDRSYGWTAVLDWSRSTDARFLSGCCAITPQ
ncbi:COG3650 family protein [Marivita sp. S2033]